MRTGSVVRVALLALIWGSGFLWIEISLRGFTPVQLTFIRLALGAAVLLGVLRLRHLELPRGAIWRHLIVAALLANAAPYLLFGIGQQSVPSNLAGAINATTPLWAVLFAVIAKTEPHLGSRRLIGLLVGLAGAIVILHPWTSDTASLGGTLACLAASASYGASYVYMGRHLTHRGLPPLVLSAAQLIAASGLLLLASPYDGFTPPTWRPDALLALLILGIIGTGVAYVLNYRIIQDDGPILASTVTYLLPVVAAALGVLVLDEPITAYLLFGVIIVLLGVTLTRRPNGHTAVRVAQAAPSKAPRFPNPR